MSLFLLNRRFFLLLFNLEGSWQFSNQITRKVVTENLNCYFYYVENINLYRNVFFFFFVFVFVFLLNFFSPNLKFFELLRKKRGKILIFFSRKTHFLHFFVKNSKILD